MTIPNQSIGLELDSSRWNNLNNFSPSVDREANAVLPQPISETSPIETPVEGSISMPSPRSREFVELFEEGVRRAFESRLRTPEEWAKEVEIKMDISGLLANLMQQREHSQRKYDRQYRKELREDEIEDRREARRIASQEYRQVFRELTQSFIENLRRKRNEASGLEEGWEKKYASQIKVILQRLNKINSPAAGEDKPKELEEDCQETSRAALRTTGEIGCSSSVFKSDLSAPGETLDNRESSSDEAPNSQTVLSRVSLLFRHKNLAALKEFTVVRARSLCTRATYKRVIYASGIILLYCWVLNCVKKMMACEAANPLRGRGYFC